MEIEAGYIYNIYMIIRGSRTKARKSQSSGGEESQREPEEKEGQRKRGQRAQKRRRREPDPKFRRPLNFSPKNKLGRGKNRSRGNIIYIIFSYCIDMIVA